MSKIKILDCTLRDGGYVNNWAFGERTIKKIISKLSQANIDIIECGFLTNNVSNSNKSLFNDISILKKYVYPKNKDLMYVAMIAYPNSIINNIPICDNESIDGIRVTFHEHEIDEALEVCKSIIKKGYKVFVQPVGLTSYKDHNIIKLVEKVNLIKPYAFYIVDTLGTMYKNDLLRMYYLIDNNLDIDINIGFHSHNNLQLSFSNAQELMMLYTKRTIIIDSSVFGMGRGAGNLCTELVAQYINKNILKKYNIEYLLEIIDEHLNSIYNKYPWGYSAPYCLAAINNCHPNYASYLIDKQTISIKSISDILKNMKNEKRIIFDKEYIEKIYIEYQKHYINDKEEIDVIKKSIEGSKILVLAPGKSISRDRERINEFIRQNNPIIFSINFIPEDMDVDFIFISNLKRFSNISDTLEAVSDNSKLILTSNIITENGDKHFIINYIDLLTENNSIADNAGLMLLNLLKKLLVKEVFIAGFDGYSINEENYVGEDMELMKTKEKTIELNKAIKDEIIKLNISLDVRFITESKYC